jgi:hypothetical protein
MSTETGEAPLQPDEVEAIAESIKRGEDPYVVPEELLVEPEERKPVNPSLYNQILHMKVGEKLKLALKGNKEARTILVRDANRLIQRFVLQNPRLSDEEVLALAKNRSLDQDLLRKIGEHRNWPRNYQIRLALVTNPKTPLATALPLVGQLAERDLRFISKSKNVSATVVTQVRRLLFNRERKLGERMGG